VAKLGILENVIETNPSAASGIGIKASVIKRKIVRQYWGTKS